MPKHGSEVFFFFSLFKLVLFSFEWNFLKKQTVDFKIFGTVTKGNTTSHNIFFFQCECTVCIKQGDKSTLIWQCNWMSCDCFLASRILSDHYPILHLYPNYLTIQRVSVCVCLFSDTFPSSKFHVHSVLYEMPWNQSSYYSECFLLSKFCTGYVYLYYVYFVL